MCLEMQEELRGWKMLYAWSPHGELRPISLEGDEDYPQETSQIRLISLLTWSSPIMSTSDLLAY